ncbi:hypothetical protein F5X68DRAFT_173628 [Plectosphaerella plurivora]|uniref:Sterol 3-beta-glucosyltransferase n=1 Tax=Plectosphaerella plurivora TaxID=936078 RepID=A0A9P8V6K2_9PEZI|nr:hypothetical protein F5X68DRAFT_173628 [Plectosphaerella plurivora]
MPPSSKPLPPPIITTAFEGSSTSPLPTPTQDDDPKKRTARKLQKKRRNDPSSPVAMDLSERLKGGGDDDTDDEEVLAPARGQPSFLNMNQSIFGLLAAAGSTVDFNDRFEGHSSDDDEADQDDDQSGANRTSPDKHRNRRSLYDRLDMRLPRPRDNGDASKTTVLTREPSDKMSRHRRMASGSKKLFASLPKLPKRRSKKDKEAPIQTDSPSEEASESSSEVPVSSLSDSKHDRDDSSENLENSNNRLAPVMSRMLEAKADVSMRPSFDMERLSSDHSRVRASGESASSPLAIRLAEIFGFAEPEEVIEEYPCWLLQSVLLQGYMYITRKHISFYAYLPKKAHEVMKAGYLAKSGKRNPKYNRYWMRLKGDVLAYYQNSSNLYFPSGQIDLRYGISAAITDKDKDGVHFNVVTDHRTYHFRADSAPSAKEWVKSLQRVIFRSHNEGDSVKISIPMHNVLDIEDTLMLQFAETCKIRVIDNDETYAIDEYFFSFFSFGSEAIKVLRTLTAAEHQDTENTTTGPSDVKTPVTTAERRSIALDRIGTAVLPEAVKATLSPLSPHSPTGGSPRPSFDAPRGSLDMFRSGSRRSMDLSRVTRTASPRRSFSASRSLSRHRLEDSQQTIDKHGSSDSFVQSSMEEPSFSAMVASSNEDPSASQILRRSDVFASPTMRRSASQSRERKAKQVSPALANYSGQHVSQTGEGSTAQAPTLQSIAKMGTYPLQRVGAFADYLNQSGKRMSSLLATESMGYVEKVSGMWKGGRKHYDAPAEMRTDDEDLYEDAEGNVQVSTERFRMHFALPETEKLQVTYFGFLFRVLPLYGKIYISDHHFCFRSLLPGTRTKLILPLKDVENVDKEKGFRFGYSGLCVVIRGHEEIFFEFNQQDSRDDCFGILLKSIERSRFLENKGVAHHEEDREDAEHALAEREALKEVRQEGLHGHDLKMPQEASGVADAPTILFDDPKASILDFKPAQSLRITCLTIGSRGDVQPYIALCKGLLAEGHKPRIATHAEFQGWIEGHGIEFAKIEGDPGELMRLCIENGTFTWAFLREANSMFRGWLDALLDSAWEACQNSDLLIESPSAMAGIHIAEKLSIPYWRAFTMPWTRTRAYPHAFVMPEHKMGGAYNYMTYIMFDNIFWKATAGQVNRWRNKTLKLPNTNLEKMQPNKVPFLYNFSPSVVAPPLDYSDWIRVTGYWFLDEATGWEPPKELTDFIAKARADNKKLVYVGFGSIIVNDTAKMTQEVIDAVHKADVRCILSKGWSDRPAEKGDAKDGDAANAAVDAPHKPEPEMPDDIFVIKSAPHDWLFSQIDAAAHHGGSGTTGASLRAGIPTIIRPFFGDQFFFGGRVEDIGVGICLKKWGATSFGRALKEATHNERMIVKARVLGEQIRKENGVNNAIQSIYRDMEYAKMLVKRKANKRAPTEQTEAAEEDDADADEEESWTFVGKNEPDPDVMTKRLSEMHSSAAGGTVPGMGTMRMPQVGGRKALGSKVMAGGAPSAVA